MMLRQTHFVAPVPLIVAIEHDLLSRAGLHVEVTDTRGSDEQFAQLAAGEQDLAVTASDNLFAWNTRGVAMRAIAQTERTTPLALYAQPDVTRIEDLANRTFAVDALGNGFALAARRILADAGVTVWFDEVGGVRERWQALQSGEADATLLGPPFDAFAEQQGLRRIASINELLPGYPGQVLVVSVEQIRNRRDELQQYINVLEEAVTIADAMTNEEGLALMMGRGLPRPAAAARWEERPRSLQVDVGGLGVVASVRRDLQLLSETWTMGDLFDDSFAGQS